MKITAAEATELSRPTWEKMLEQLYKDIRFNATNKGKELIAYDNFWDSDNNDARQVVKELQSIGFNVEFGRGIPRSYFGINEDEQNFIHIRWK